MTTDPTPHRKHLNRYRLRFPVDVARRLRVLAAERNT
jgi:hypothetical protein